MPTSFSSPGNVSKDSFIIGSCGDQNYLVYSRTKLQRMGKRYICKFLHRFLSLLRQNLGTHAMIKCSNDLEKIQKLNP